MGRGTIRPRLGAVRAGGEQARGGEGGVGKIEAGGLPGRKVQGEGFDGGDGLRCRLELDAARGVAGDVTDSRLTGAVEEPRESQD